MTNAIEQSTIITFLQEILYKPFAEGAERINRAIEGVNLHHIQHPKMNLLDRSWSLLVGVCLMVPVINSILWICMRIFGNPEILSEPFTPDSPHIPDLEPTEVSENVGVLPEQQVFNAEPPTRGAPLSVRPMKYTGVANERHFNATWSFETYKDMYYVTSDDETMHAETSFDLDWNQKTHFIKTRDTSIIIERQLDSLFVKGYHQEKPIDKELKLPNQPYPWIQQPTTGFRPFILSKDQKLRFYGIHPLEFAIRECIAEKEEVYLDPYGKVIKVTFKLNDGFAAWLGDLGRLLGHCWFNPENGDLLKMEYRIGVFAWGESNIVQDP